VGIFAGLQYIGRVEDILDIGASWATIRAGTARFLKQ
jgi:hypothetical protein